MLLHIESVHDLEIKKNMQLYNNIWTLLKTKFVFLRFPKNDFC